MQSSPYLHPLHLLFGTLPDPPNVPFRIQLDLCTAEATGDDGGHCGRL
jgi:hypothetical protein